MTIEGRVGESTIGHGQLTDDIIEVGGIPARRGSGIELNPLQHGMGAGAVVVPQQAARRPSAEAVALSLLDTVQRSGQDPVPDAKHGKGTRMPSKGEQEVISPFYQRGTASSVTSLTNGDGRSGPRRPWQGMLSMSPDAPAAPQASQAPQAPPAPVPRTSASRRPWQGLLEGEAGDNK